MSANAYPRRFPRFVRPAVVANPSLVAPSLTANRSAVRPWNRNDNGRRVLAGGLLMAAPPGDWPASGPAWIVALDIERLTSCPNPIKGELRNKTYELFEVALRTAGIENAIAIGSSTAATASWPLFIRLTGHPRHWCSTASSRFSAACSSPITTPCFHASANRNGNCGSVSSCMPARSTTTLTDVSVRPWMSAFRLLAQCGSRQKGAPGEGRSAGTSCLRGYPQLGRAPWLRRHRL